MLWYETRGRKKQGHKTSPKYLWEAKIQVFKSPLRSLSCKKSLLCCQQFQEKCLKNNLQNWMMLCNVKDKLSVEAWILLQKPWNICTQSFSRSHYFWFFADCIYLALGNHNLENLCWEQTLTHLKKSSVCKQAKIIKERVTIFLKNWNVIMKRIFCFFRRLKRRWEGRKTIWVSH